MNTSNNKQFELKPEHIKLLQAAYIGWDYCEFGAPVIDCKRPYGNSFVYGDIAEILGIEPINDEFTTDQRDLMYNLHYETGDALQIILATKSFEPGLYIAPRYSNEWRKAG